MHLSKHRRIAVISSGLAFLLFAISVSFIQVTGSISNDPSATLADMRHSHNFYANTLHHNDAAAKEHRQILLVRDEEESELHDSANDEDVSIIYLPEKRGMMSKCLYVAPEEPTFTGEVVSVVVPDSIGPDDVFEVEVSVLNTGDAAWFRNDYCENQTSVNLGTAAEQDRSSLFGGDDYAVSGWLSDTRIEMVEDVVNPEETATFKFSSKGNSEDAWYKEYFMPVAEGIRWMDEALVEVDIKMGMTDDIDTGIMDIVDFSTKNTDLEGEKWMHVDLSEQEMQLMVGETAIWTFTISSGAWDTPTPTGTYYISNKQDLRIGGAWPHYRMPNWMGFTNVGYGLHALPYLADDSGAFWYEALDHIGTPVSHGCIRQLPDDSEKVYAFGEIGMELVIEN